MSTSLRSTGSAVISLGLVSVPVKLFSSAESKAAISFNMLHKDCGSRLEQKYFCKTDGEEVPSENRVKGYEYSKGEYLLFSPEELKFFEAENNSVIEIEEFVPLTELRMEQHAKTYFLAPGKGGEKAFALIAAALKKSKRTAIGRYAARGKEYVVAIHEQDGGLALEQLFFADEVRSIDQLDLLQVKVSPDELALAVKLVEMKAAPKLELDKYEDRVRSRIMAAIEQKLAGQDIVIVDAPAPQEAMPDLMAALQASLGQLQSAEA